MNFDFYQQYKTYSNIDLLKIVKRPEDYQPNAVVVASQILSDRQVSPEEIQFINQYYQGIDNSKVAQKEKVEAIKNKTIGFFEPVLYPSKKVQPKKWIDLLLLAIGIEYAYLLYEAIKNLVRYLTCTYCKLDFVFYSDVLALLYIPVICILLFKRKRWGWILLFADNLFSLIGSVSQSYIFFKLQRYFHWNINSYLWPILVNTAFVFFLWRNSVADYFEVTHQIKKKTSVITTIGTVTFVVIMYILF